MKIHPSALVEPGAQLADDVEIGAFVCLGADVEIGAGCRIASHAVLEGRVVLGAGNVIGHGAIIGAAPQDLSFQPTTRSEVRIGSRNVIREHCTIHRGTAEASATVLGDDNFLMAGAHLGHNVRLGHKVIVANNCLLAGYVEVQDGAFLGGGCVFHQHMRVGRLAITQGASGFGKDLPPFTIGAETNYVFGLNAIGLRRAGFDAMTRAEIKRAFKLLYTSGLNTTQALEEAAGQTWGTAAAEFFTFVRAAKKRGLCAFKKSPAAPSD